MVGAQWADYKFVRGTQMLVEIFWLVQLLLIKLASLTAYNQSNVKSTPSLDN
jgi:hypothetical protein